MKKILGFVLLLGVLTACSTSKSSADKKAAKAEATAEAKAEIKAVLASNAFVFTAEQAIGQKGMNVNVVGDKYTLELKNDSAKAHLPFYGRAFAGSGASFGNEGGVQFEGPVEEFKKDFNEKKQRNDYTFKVKKDINVYSIRLEVYDNGSASLNISQTSRTPMTYYGSVSKIKDQPED